MSVVINEDADNRLVIKLPNLMDLKNGSDIKEIILNNIGKKDYKSYIIDLSELEFIDSLGLGILVGIQRKILSFNKTVVFRNPRKSIQKLFEITQLQRVFNVEYE
jgi:anti-sigma B factor antagonist